MQNNDFNNYKNKSVQFDSFNGTELKCFVKVPTSYDEYGNLKTFELAELGTASAISAITNYEVTPLPTIGYTHPKGIAVGSSLVSGSIVFEILNEGFVNEVIEILKDAGMFNIEIEFDADHLDGTPKYEYREIKALNDFPDLDIVMIGVKENNPNKKIEKQIIGIRFNKGSSGIGVTQLSVREKLDFIAKKMTDFKPVIGATETEEEEPAVETLIFT